MENFNEGFVRRLRRATRRTASASNSSLAQSKGIEAIKMKFIERICAVMRKVVKGEQLTIRSASSPE